MIGPNLSAWAIARRSLIYFFMAAAIIAGASSFLKLGRAEDPAFAIRTMVVAAAWPGATLEDTIEQVTERLERKLQETVGLDRLRSFTRPGFTTIFVDIEGATSSAELPDIWYQVRKKIGDIRHTLPQGTVGPFFNDDFGDTYGIIYGFTSDGFTQRELRDQVERVRSDLLLIPDVAKIDILGAQDERIFLELNPDRIANLGLNFGAVFAAVAAQNVVRPSGVIRTAEENVALRVSGAFESELDVLEVSIPAGDRLIRLGDIADVRRGLVDPPQPMFRVNGEAAIGLAIAMRESADILALGDNIKRRMAQITADLPIGIEPFLVADQAVTVDGAINDFTTSLWQAIAIIIAISFLSLGARAGTVVALAIPITMAVVFLTMDLLGIDLHRISLGALIIALGLLVDDAMTTVDAMLRRVAAGDSMEAAGSYAYSNLAAPMLIGALVTVAGFVPIGFAASSAGEYTFSIFSVVGIALVASWLVAVLFAPLIGIAVLKKPEGPVDAAPGPTVRLYTAALGIALKFRYVTIALTLAAFALAVAGLSQVPRQFFPASDRPELLIDLTLPQSASIHATADVVERIDRVLAEDDDVVHWSAYVGRGAIRFYLPLNVILANDFVAQHVIVAKDLAARDRLQEKLDRVLDEQFPEVVSRVYPLELGPPVGWPLQWRVSGTDIDRVRAISQELAVVMAGHPSVKRVNFDWIEPGRQVRVNVDQTQARRLGISSEALAGMLNLAVTGATISQVRDDIYLIDIVVRAGSDTQVSLQTLQTLQLPLPSGRTVALSSFATFEYSQEQPIVWRRDRLQTLTVRADIEGELLPEDIVTALTPAIDQLNASLPFGYNITVGGIAEESAESQASVLAVVPLMFFLMLSLLMLMLQSFQRLFMVVVMLPLGLIGVVAALLLSGSALGFVAILGILALIGMIAKNAVILIVQIEADRATGLSVREAVVASAIGRFRPMMLAALSTILGLIPIAPTVFWGPMAFAIMGGLFVATLLTLLFLPAVYVAWFDRGSKGG